MAYEFNELLAQMMQRQASDLHLTVGIAPSLRVNGELVRVGTDMLKTEDIEAMVESILSKDEQDKLDEYGEIDLCMSRPNLGRYRMNIFRQRNTYAIAVRLINTKIPDFKTLGLPEVINEIVNKTRGLFLVTGPTGSGKSTTLASMIDMINKTRSNHIITLEDPIEYLHRHNKSIVNQRDIGRDSKSYEKALRAALREDPDVILIGEMRDLETISIALTAAETGHLVLSTLHTLGAAKTVDRIIDVFPPHQQQQIRTQLSTILIGTMSQLLLPRIDRFGRIGIFEVMLANPAIRNLIRESKTHQIQSIMQMHQKEGMVPLDTRLLEYFAKGIITRDEVLTHATDYEYVLKATSGRNY